MILDLWTTWDITYRSEHRMYIKVLCNMYGDILISNIINELPLI